MRGTTTSCVAILVLGAASTLSCRSATTETNAPTAELDAGPAIVQPGAPGAPSREISAEEATDLSAVGHTPADVQFMQGMIHHHAQALDMTSLIPSRTEREDMLALGKRIQLSQEDEIGMMQEWLEVRGESAPGVEDHRQPGSMLMPGMLTAEEMDRLASSTGAEFDRLFLEGMVKHHEGALIMVDELLATPGAGQESVMFAFVSEVVADQSAEIGRMNAMLNAMREE